MGLLVPADFDLGSLRNAGERVVVEALVDRLSDGWVVIPSVGFSGSDRDRELDVVVAHARDGIAVIEVKESRPTIRDGAWYSGPHRMSPQPMKQAADNAYKLRKEIRSLHPTLRHVNVEYAVALPNVREISGALPPDAHRSQILTSTDLEDPLDAVERLLCRRSWNTTVGESGLRQIVRMLRPDAEFEHDPELRARLARLKLDTICKQQVDALAGLDANRRVCVTGAAGTGKTRLATEWARRARLRGERVLLTCFNIPLADTLRDAFAFDDEIRVGAFHDVARSVDGMPPLEVPDDADREWWDTVELAHLVDHWDEITERFDTVVVDEAQDFNPVWLDLLARLLDPDGSRRLLLVADEAQEVYVRGFTPPDPDAGWVRCELTNNCRNTSTIAALLYRRFGAAVPAAGGPESEDLRTIVADDLESAVEAVGDAYDTLEDRGHGARTILVATFTSSVRERLIEDYGFVRWENRGPNAVVCENVHRVKGLEFDHVILLAHDDSVSEELLYVGLSRPAMSATLIGPTALLESIVGATG